MIVSSVAHEQATDAVRRNSVIVFSGPSNQEGRGGMKATILARRSLLSFFAVASLAASPGQAQSTAPGAGTAARPRVVGVEPRRAGLGERIFVRVENLPALVGAAQGGCSDVVLFLDGLSIAGLEPSRCNLDDGSVSYELKLDEKNEADDAAWHSLLGSPDGLVRPVRLSLGPSQHVSIETEVRGERAFQLVLLYDLYFYLWLGVTVLLVGCSIWLARRSNLLRDPYAIVPEGAKRPYSLSRFQAVFWCVLVLISFFLIWTITGELGSITGSVLGLLGIGSGTALGAALIDSDKTAPRTQGGGTPAATGVAQSSFKGASSGSFLHDILSGENGISFHRFQMFVWTIVLGLIFCSTVYDTLSMPQFDTSLLALLGISSGTYLGFKIPEKHEAGPASPMPPAAGGTTATPAG
jgi:hypothetical protein